MYNVKSIRVLRNYTIHVGPIYGGLCHTILCLGLSFILFSNVYLFFSFLSRENGDTVLQVDMDLMDELVSNLVEYLRLENAYNIFILNPKRDAKRPKYGYRCVFW